MKNTYKVLSTVVNNFNAWRGINKLPQFKLPTNPISLKRKIERFEAEGYSSLLKGYDNNNRGKAVERTLDLLDSMFAHQTFKPSPAEVHRQLSAFLSGYVEIISNETGEVFDPKSFNKVSQRTVTMFLNSWGSSVATSRKRTGNRQIRLGQYVPFEQLEHPKFAGSIISVDDRQPPFEYKKELACGFIWESIWEAKQLRHGYTAHQKRVLSLTFTARWYAIMQNGDCRYQTRLSAKAT